MIKLGANTVLYKPFSLRVAVENLKKIGYDGFEISAILGMCEHLKLDSWEEQKNEILEMVQEFEMPILAMEVASTDPERLDLAFRAASGLNIPVVNRGPGGRSNVPKDLTSCFERMDQLAGMAQAYGVTLCMKAHVGCAVYSTPTTLPCRKVRRKKG
jgi:sugar phosphate isomerase/epimerase